MEPLLFADLPVVPVPALGPSPAEVARMLRRTRVRVGSEALLQEDIAAALTRAELTFDREARLGPAERIDFLVGGVGIEAKVKCPKRSIFRQLERYAAHAQVSSLILVTNTAMGLPSEIAGKPLFFVSTGRASL